MTTYAWDIADEGMPGPDIVPITPDDATNISTTIHGIAVVGVRALRVENGGDVKVTMADGNDRVLKFADGETRIGQFLRVWSTGTTASGQIEGHV
jgi:hypothetical protein